MTAPLTPAFTPQDPINQLAEASVELAMLADRSATDGPWASGAMHLLASRGVLAAFVPADCGGIAADEPALLDILAAIASTCLTTALAVSQWAAAVRIIATATPEIRTTLLPPLARGELFTTVGTSQLTTSRQHLCRPALLAARDGDAWRLDGLCPWVTGADACHTLVTGAATADGGQAFFVVRTDASGILIDPPLELLALSGTRTAVVHFAGVCPAHLIMPPERTLARTGGLATTALALGAARAAIRVVAGEANRRDFLAPVAAGLAAELASPYEPRRLITARALRFTTIARPEVATSLSIALVDEASSVRAAAAQSLGTFGSDAAHVLPALEKAKDDVDAHVRQMANTAYDNVVRGK